MYACKAEGEKRGRGVSRGESRRIGGRGKRDTGRRREGRKLDFQGKKNFATWHNILHQNSRRQEQLRKGMESGIKRYRKQEVQISLYPCKSEP